MTNENVECLLCGKSAVIERCVENTVLKRRQCICSNCGIYSFGKEYSHPNNKVIQSLYYFILNEKSSNTDIVVISEDNCFNVVEEKEGVVQYISEEYILNYYPNNFSQKVDKSLLNLSKIYSEYDSKIYIKTGGLASEVHKNLHIAKMIKNLVFMDCVITENITAGLYKTVSFLDLMVDMGYLKKSGVSGDLYYNLSSNGWLRIQELQSVLNTSEQAFVAMWFTPQTANVWDKIKKAIKTCGYIPVRIDEKEHNNQIVPEILYEIRKSRFIVADLTGHRNGVYYEAGYAQALGREVILTCDKKEFESRHFDIAQQNMIVWNDDQDLYDRLVKRIEVTIGKKT